MNSEDFRNDVYCPAWNEIACWLGVGGTTPQPIMLLNRKDAALEAAPKTDLVVDCRSATGLAAAEHKMVGCVWACLHPAQVSRGQGMDWWC